MSSNFLGPPLPRAAGSWVWTKREGKTQPKVWMVVIQDLFL